MNEQTILTGTITEGYVTKRKEEILINLLVVGDDGLKYEVKSHLAKSDLNFQKGYSEKIAHIQTLIRKAIEELYSIEVYRERVFIHIKQPDKTIDTYEMGTATTFKYQDEVLEPNNEVLENNDFIKLLDEL